MHTSVCDHVTYKDPFSFFFSFLVQFNSCPNLPSNYTNEFIVGGSPSWLSRDLGSLGKGQNVSLAHVWQCKRSSRKRKDKEREGAGMEGKWRIRKWAQLLNEWQRPGEEHN